MKRPFIELEIDVVYFNSVDVLTVSIGQATDQHDVWGDDPYDNVF